MLGHETDEFDLSVAIARVRADKLRVPTGVWESVEGGEYPSRKRVGDRPLAHIARDLKAALRAAMGDHYATEWWDYDVSAFAAWPGEKDHLVSVAEGPNEGYLLKVLAHTPNLVNRLAGTYTTVFTVKLLCDPATAWDMARLVDMILTA